MEDIGKIKEDIERVRNEIDKIPSFSYGNVTSGEIKEKIIEILAEAEKSAKDVEKINSIKQEIESRIINPIDLRIKNYSKSNNIFSAIGLIFGILGIILTVITFFDSSNSSQAIIMELKELSANQQKSYINQEKINKTESDLMISKIKRFYEDQFDSIQKILNVRNIPIKTKKLSNKIYLFKDTVTNKYGFLDNNNNVVISPKYELAYEFSENLLQVRIDGKWGVIDNSGKNIIKPRFDGISNIHRNHFLASIYEDEMLLYNIKGRNLGDVNDYLEWSDYEKLLRNSSLPDKDLIIRILEMYSDLEKRKKAVIQLSMTYPGVSPLIIDKMLQKGISYTENTIKIGKAGNITYDSFTYFP